MADELRVTSVAVEVLSPEPLALIRPTSASIEYLSPSDEIGGTLRPTSVALEYLEDAALTPARVTSAILEYLGGLSALRTTSLSLEYLIALGGLRVTSSFLEFLTPRAVPDVIAESLEEVPDGVVAIAVTSPSANAESRQLLRGPSATFDVLTFVIVGATVDASVLTLFDETAPVGETAYYATAAILGDSRAYSNVVTVAVSLGTRPATPTIALVSRSGLEMITDDSVEVLSSDFSDSLSRPFAFARYEIRTLVGAVAFTFDILATDNWQQPILAGLAPAGTAFRVYLQHFAVRTGDDAGFPPIPSLFSAPLEFTLLETGEPGVDEDPVTELPILSSGYRSEYPYGTFSATVSFSTIDLYKSKNPCAEGYSERYPFYLRMRGSFVSSNLAGQYDKTFDFLSPATLFHVSSWYQYACRAPDDSIDPPPGWFSGRLKNTIEREHFIVPPFAPDTPMLLDGRVNIFGGKIIAEDSFAFRWEEDARCMCWSQSSKEYADTLIDQGAFSYQDVELVLEELRESDNAIIWQLWRVNDFQGEWTIYGTVGDSLDVLGTLPFGPRYFEVTPVGIRWLHRAYYRWNDVFDMEGWEFNVDFTAFEQGHAQLATRLDGRVLRTTAPFMVDRAEADQTFFTRQGAALVKSELTIEGSAGEADRWADIADGVVRSGEPNTGGFAAFDELAAPRDATIIVRQAYATKRHDSSSNGFKFTPDMRSRFGPAVYLNNDAGFSALVARLEGFFGATGYYYQERQGTGATDYSWWSSGIRHALGLGYQRVIRYGPAGSPISGNLIGDLGQMNQWNRSGASFGAEQAEYTVLLKTRLLRALSDGSYDIEVTMFVHGPDMDTSTFLSATPFIDRSHIWPCGMLGLFGESSSYCRQEFYGFTSLVVGYGDCATVPVLSEVLVKAWAFVLDGHIFYVLNGISGKSYLYDLTTGQWCRWRTQFRTYWNMHRGIHWQDNILAADVELPIVWKVDPSSELDEGAFELSRIVSGFQALRGKETLRIGSLRVTASVGFPHAASPVILLRYSDDYGETWSQYYQIDLTNDDEQKLKFRSLGRVRAPGRLWEISDVGGLLRIDGADSTQDEPS